MAGGSTIRRNIRQAKSNLRVPVDEFADRDDMDFGYCCLGVACEISGLGKWDPDGRNISEFVVDDDTDCQSSDPDFCCSDIYLPEAVMDWLGIKSQDGSRLTDQ